MARDSTISAPALGADVIDVTRLRVAIARLSRRLRRHELAGLTPTQLAALATVERSGPMRLGDLAAAEGIAPSTLTRLVTALDEAGYVQRHADPSDARASTLAITEKGHQVLERLREEGTALLTESLLLLTPEQRVVLADALPVLEQLAEGDPKDPRNRLPAGHQTGHHVGGRRPHPSRLRSVVRVRRAADDRAQVAPGAQRDDVLAGRRHAAF
jgi:DNA-binding MarR family transcriptional regulator